MAAPGRAGPLYGAAPLRGPTETGRVLRSSTVPGLPLSRGMAETFCLRVTPPLGSSVQGSGFRRGERLGELSGRRGFRGGKKKGEKGKNGCVRPGGGSR